MNVWRVIGQIASGFGIIFIVFAVFSAFITYEAISLQGGIPAGYLQVNLLNAMLPYLLYAILSFVVAGIILRANKENVVPAEVPPEKPETELEQPSEETSL